MMNRCFLIGKVLNDPEFYFLYMKSKISISYFYLKLFDGNILKIFGYDENADYIYRNININEIIIVDGTIRTDNKIFEIEISKIEKIRN